MKKTKTKLKKIMYKVIPCFVIFCILFTFCFVTNAVESPYVNDGTFSSLDNILSGVVSGDFVYDDVNNPPQNFTSPFFRSKSTSSNNAIVTLVGSFNLLPKYNPNRYYTITIPLSVIAQRYTVGNGNLFLIDNNGVSYPFELVSRFQQDPLNSAYTTTHIFKITISGSNLQSISKLKFDVLIDYWSGYDDYYVEFGLLNGRYIEVSSMSQYEYESLYGGNNQPIAPNGNNTVASYESYEQQLLESGGFTQAVAFYESFDNARIQLPIVTASRLVSELFNYDSDGITIFETIATFSLSLGIICLFLAIAPRLKGVSK